MWVASDVGGVRESDLPVTAAGTAGTLRASGNLR